MGKTSKYFFISLLASLRWRKTEDFLDPIMDLFWVFFPKFDFLNSGCSLYAGFYSMCHLSIAVYCAKNWKLLLAGILHFSCMCANKILTKGGQAQMQESFQFSHFSYQ